MDALLNNHLVAGIGAVLAFVIFIILLLHMVKILMELRRRLPRGGRSRQLRLGFVENFDLDGERQLLLVRRDNVEHLLMIGGPNDLLVESGIVRAETREHRTPRTGMETGATSAPVLAPSALSAPQPELEIAAPSEALPPPPTRDSPFSMRRARVVAPVEPKVEEARAEPKVEDEPADGMAPPAPDAPEMDLEGALRAALEAAPLQDEPEPVAPSAPPPVAPPPVAPPPVAPSAPIAPPPPAAGSRFSLPPRPVFKAPLPPRPVAPSTPSAPPSGAGPGSDQPRPRFVIPPLARRAPAPTPTPQGETPAAQETPAPAAQDLFGRGVVPPPPPAPPAAPEPVNAPAPAPQTSPETLESLEEEMAKLLGRPTNK